MSSVWYSEKAREIAETAKKNGCTVINVFGLPYCGCADNLHHGDQQASMIVMRTAVKRRASHLRLVK